MRNSKRGAAKQGEQSKCRKLVDELHRVSVGKRYQAAAETTG